MFDNIGRRTVMKAMGATALLGLSGSGSADVPGGTATDDIYGANATGSFSVTIGGTTIDEWERVQIPGDRSSKVERESTDGDHTRSLLGQTEYEMLEMEREMKPGDTTLVDWRKDIRQGKIEEGRQTVTVTLNDSSGNPVIEWEFTEAWVKEYGALELDGSDYGETATESVTVEFDELTRTNL